MTLQTKRYLIGFLGLLFLASLVLVQAMEIARKHEEVGLTSGHVAVPAKSKGCVECHGKSSPGIIDHWKFSTHARKGVGCVECHQAQKGDVDGFTHYGHLIATIVTPKDCGRCHEKETTEFIHSHHAKAGNILASLDNFLAETVEGSRTPFNPHSPTPGKPDIHEVNGMASAAVGCQQCHGSKVALLAKDGGKITLDDLKPDAKGQPTNLEVLDRIAKSEDGRPKLHADTWPNTGIERLNLDGSLGSCSACHSRHDFSPRRARQPENCGKCHLGPDHPQKEIYEESKHGVAFRDLKDHMNLNAKDWVLGKDYSQAPTCATCHMSGHSKMGFMTQFQSDEPMGCYDDFEIGDDFILWGNNMAEMHPVLFSRMLEHKRTNRGVRIIDLATRWTQTSQYADVFVQFNPGSDLAIANGILHLLVESGRFDKAFLDENVVFKRGIEDLDKIGYGCFGEQAEQYKFEDQPKDSSFDELQEFLKDYTPEKVRDISGVPVEQLKLLADIYGNQARNTVSLWCMGVNQHTRGTWMNNLITDLHLLTGKISRPGNNPFSLTGQPSACGTAREVGTLSNRLPADMVVTNPEHRKKAEEIWGLPDGTINPKPGLHTIDMFRALTRGDVKAMWIQVTNPWVSLPNLTRFERKPNDGRFIVVSDIYPTPTTAIADLVLPSAAWVEREGMFGNTERRTQHWDKLIDPPGEAKEDAWQIMQVARRMGYDKLFPWPDDDWHKPMFEEYRRFTLGNGKDLASYEQLRETRGLRWPVVNGRETKYRYAAGHDPYVKKPKGVHFYKAKGFGEKAAFWLRPYHPPAEVPDDEFPFWLSTGRVLEHWHTGSMTRRVKQLHQAMPEAYVELSRVDADRLGIVSGQKVRVVSRRGRLELKAKIDERGQPPAGSVFIPFFDESRLANVLTLDAMDNISKEPDYKKCAVRVEKV